MNSILITGLGFGDEGKGMTTAWLAANACVYAQRFRKYPNALVIRYGGGNQIAHTVKLGDKYHVHHHVGSGTLFNVPTYYSEYCTVDPIGVLLEIDDISSNFPGTDIKIWYHPKAMLVTPMDVRAQQSSVTNKQHGTVGVGFGTTVKRNENGLNLFMMDLTNPFIFKNKFKAIQKYYGDYTDSVDFYVNVFTEFINLKNIKICKVGLLDCLKKTKKVDLIFEGHQGVLLDMEYGMYPHITRSKTTVTNALNMLRGIQYKDSIYNIMVTRSYHTRHGNGPFLDNHINLKNIETEQNKEHIYQGVFQTSALDVELLGYAINANITDYGKDLPRIKKSIMITCCDQVSQAIASSVLTKIICNTNKTKIYMSYSPDGTNIKPMI